MTRVAPLAAPAPEPTASPSQHPSAAPASASASSRLEQELVARALRKMVNREELSAQERSALKRHEKEKEERLRWQYYGSIPQKHWREMSGRQTKVINEQSARYGLPFGGAVINLPALAGALHDFLAENALKLAKDDDLSLGGGGNSPALERYREERAALARLDRLERERELLPRYQVKESLGRIAAIVREAGDALGRQFGHAATEILYEALDDAQREIDRSFSGNGQAEEERPNTHEEATDAGDTQRAQPPQHEG